METLSIKFNITDPTLVDDFGRGPVDKEKLSAVNLINLIYLSLPKSFDLELKIGDYIYKPDHWSLPRFFFHICGTYFGTHKDGILAELLYSDLEKSWEMFDNRQDEKKIPALKKGRGWTFWGFGELDSRTGFYIYFDKTDVLEFFPRTYSYYKYDESEYVLVPPFNEVEGSVENYLPILLSKKQVCTALYKYALQHIKYVREILPDFFNDEYNVLKQLEQWKSDMKAYKEAIEKL